MVLNQDMQKAYGLFKNMPVAYMIFKVGTKGENNRFTFFYANGAFVRLYEITGGGLAECDVMDYLPVKYASAYFLVATAGENKTFFYFNRALRKYLKVFCYQPIYGYCACLIDDVTEQFNFQQLLKIRARSDSLTGLFNKEATHNDIIGYLKGKKARNLAHAMIVLDLDNFKEVNDYFGHIYGDALLLEISNRIRSLFRTTDIVGRIGGDEFMIFMKNIKKRENVLKKAHDLCYLINENYNYFNANLAITSSVGIAIYPDAGREFDTLYNNADVALYKAKVKGKNMYYVFNEKECIEDYDKIVHYNTKMKKDKFSDYIARILTKHKNPDDILREVMFAVCTNYGFPHGYICAGAGSQPYATVCSTFNPGEERILVPDQSRYVFDCIGRFDYCYLTSSSARDLIYECFGEEYRSIYFHALHNDGYIGFIGFYNTGKNDAVNVEHLGELAVLCKVIANYYIETKYKGLLLFKNRSS